MDKYGGRHTVETSHPAIHSEAVNCLARIQPGFCLSGSKDQVDSRLHCLSGSKN